MNPFWGIVRSILITCAISAVFGLLYINIFWQIFACATAAQIIVYYCISLYRDILMERAMNERLEIASRQELLLKCPCPTQCEELVPMVLSKKNSYDCRACQKKIVVNIEASTALDTDPVNIEHSQIELAKIYNKLTEEIKTEDD